MKIELEGRIRNIHLSFSKALHPLFEAVVNSIEAIEERGISNGYINISIERNQHQEAFEQLADGVDKPIIGFRIEDNGVGFDEKNFNAFETSDTTYKENKGGKGVGRFLWLKAFDKVEVESIFRENGKYKERRFEFIIKGNGIENLVTEEIEQKEITTAVRLIGFKDDYSRNCIKNAEKIALQIVDHCLIYFMSENCPKIKLHDEGQVIDLNRIYIKNVKKEEMISGFEIRKQKFQITHLKLASTTDSHHRIHYCANGREVKTENLQNLMNDIDKELHDEDDNKFFYSGYVSGSYLDDRVNMERTEFDISKEPLLDKNEVNWPEIREGVKESVNAHLESSLHKFREEKFEHIINYVKNKAPRYRALIKHRKELIEDIPAGLSDEKLDLELHKRQGKLEIEIKEQGQEILSKDFASIDDLPEFLERYNKIIEEVNDVGKTQLADYIVKRKLIIELFEKTLEFGNSEKYKKEDNIHRIIFPLRQVSDDIDYNEHNLWMIDEKLSYHAYLASDKELRQMDIIKSESKQRPDIIIFDCPFALVEDDPPFKSVVIIEFKKPGREGYGKDKNPIDQVYDYVRQVKDGKARDKAGKLISVSENTPFYAYIMCDLVPQIRKLAENADLAKTPDNMGYFGYNKSLATYVEIISFDKLVQDSKKRNKILFDKLLIS